MKTLQIGNDWPGERVGGLNRYFVELLRSLPSVGTTVKGLVVGPSAIAEETGRVVEPFAGRSDSVLKRCYNVREAALRELRGGGIDMIASHFALYTAPLGKWASRVPMVVHFHGPWAAESDVEGSPSLTLRVKLAVERNVYNKADRFIVLSRAFQQELVARYRVNEELTRIVPGGIDTSRFNMDLTRAEARQRLGWPEDRPVLLAVRRMVRRMGLENLVDAMRGVIESCPEVLLLLAGAGPLSAELQNRIRERGLETHVKLLGRVSEEHLPLAYRAADMTIVPSQSLEGFGMITLESLASGTPVLVTPVGGLPEVVRPFAPACVFDDTSPAAMEQALTMFLRGSAPLPHGDECRRYAVEHFAWPIIAARVNAVYREALA